MIDSLLKVAESFLEELLAGKSHGKPGLENLKNFVSRRNNGLTYDGNPSFQQLTFSNRNAGIYGGTGTGKSSVFAIPNALYNTEHSKVILDPSGELTSICAPAMAMQGYDIKIVNLNDVSKSDFYNPLKRLDSSFSSCKQLAALLVRNSIGGGTGDIFWNTSATNCIAIFLYLTQRLDAEHRHLAMVLHLINEFSTGNKKVDELAIRLCENPLVWSEFKALKATEPRVLNSVLSTARAALSLWQAEEVSFLTSRDNLSFEALRNGQKPVAIFIQGNSLKMKFFAPLFSALVSQLFTYLLNTIPKPKDRNIIFILDELASFYIPEFEIVMSVNRKFNISICCLLQSPSQLSHIYSERINEILMANMASQLYFGNMDLLSCKRISEIAGKYEVENEDGKKHKENVLDIDSIRNMPNTDAILLLPGTRPIYVQNVQPYYKNKVLMRLIQSAPPIDFSHYLPIITPLLNLNDYAKT